MWNYLTQKFYQLQDQGEGVSWTGEHRHDSGKWATDKNQHALYTELSKLIKSSFGQKTNNDNRRVANLNPHVANANLEKKEGKSNEVNDSQSMYQAPDSRMGPNKYPVTKLPGHWISIVRKYQHIDLYWCTE